MSVLNKSQVPSPCQSICLLDEDDICTGCGRTGMEISYWGRFATEQQQQVVKRAALRQQGHQQECVWQASHAVVRDKIYG